MADLVTVYPNVIDFGKDVYNVTSPPYNSVGDGATDCTAAITAALAEASAADGVVYFPAGTYTVGASGALPIYSNTIWFGEGAGVSVIQSHSTNDYGAIAKQPHGNGLTGLANVTFIGLTFDGNSATGAGTGTGTVRLIDIELIDTSVNVYACAFIGFHSETGAIRFGSAPHFGGDLGEPSTSSLTVPLLGEPPTSSRCSVCNCFFASNATTSRAKPLPDLSSQATTLKIEGSTFQWDSAGGSSADEGIYWARNFDELPLGSDA